MAERIPEEILTEIRARVSIVEVISAHVALRKAGRNLVGLCPFHGEHTPSFSVNEEGGFFHCFGCGVGGNVFTFLTKIEGISFPEAVRRLAAKAGVSLPQTERDPQAQERARLYRLNELAATYFQRCLWGNVGGTARQYLETRGISTEIAERFRLGFAPPWGEGLARFLSTQQADLERATTLGLVGKRDKGRSYDKFRHRLIFPITDVLGRIIGFGGRLLPMPQQSSETTAQKVALPKYLNSPDSALYQKGTSLYGLFQAKEAIQHQGRVLVVEGYIDLLAIVQAGYAEAVAVLGTALSVEQLKLVRRFTREVYLFFDGDEAGRRAATRAFPLCLEIELRGKGVFLPQGYDPDTFAREYGADQLGALLDRAEPLEEFYFARHMPPPGASVFQRAQAVKEAIAVLQPMTDVVVRGALLTQIAQRFGINEEEVRRITTGQEASRGPAQIRERQKPAQDLARTEHGTPTTAETELLQLLLLDRRAALRIAEEGILPAFRQWGELAAEIIAAWQQQGQIDLGAILDRLPKALADRVTRAYTAEEQEEEVLRREQLLADCIAKIRAVQRKTKREQLRRELRETELRGDETTLKQQLQRLQEWSRQE